MKISQCITYINQALNYPAIILSDISVYFDMAIAELNTTLHTTIPTLHKMDQSFRRYVSNATENKVLLSASSETNPITTSSEPPSDVDYYYDTSKSMYGIKIDDTWKYYKSLYGVFSDGGYNPSYMEAYMVSENAPMWVKSELDPEDLDLNDYLPDDWVLLWLIPYICFKYTCRDGGTAQTFADELTQGFQQLQETYSVPASIILTTYAEKNAYREEVLANLANLNIRIPTKAIFEDMKHARNVNATYGSMYDRGGFGI